MNFRYPPGATPLDLDAAAGLIPELAIQGELNEFEAANILRASRWATRSRILRPDYPNVSALRELHRRMFDQTWRWAGQFRRVGTNIGVPWSQIAGDLLALCDDVRYHIEHNVYPWDERAVRFHHRLVSIHPFPNGNGRHARLATDLLLLFHQQSRFTWGSDALVADAAPRRTYIAALRAADRGDLAPLLAFART